MEAQGRKTFLLIEDDSNDAFEVEIEFRNRPQFVLRWVRNGEEAIHYLEGKPPYDDRERHPFPDVILLDLNMPRISGFEFLEWLHRKPSDVVSLIPVMVRSGSALQEDIERAYRLGAECYLPKPTDWNEFREELERVEIFWGELVGDFDLESGNEDLTKAQVTT